MIKCKRKEVVVKNAKKKFINRSYLPFGVFCSKKKKNSNNGMPKVLGILSTSNYKMQTI